MNCKISVIMPVFNEENYLRASIESILNQTFSDFEFIIIDDGSTDNTSKIIESYKDNRIQFIKNKKKGIVKQLNFGINVANSQIIARMDADDVAECNRFEEQFDYLRQHPEVHVVGSNVLYLNEKSKIICEKKYPQYHNDIEFMMPIESSVCHPSVMMRKEIFKNERQYSENFKYAEDYELFINLLVDGYKFYNIQKLLLRYRVPVSRIDQKRVSNSNEIAYKLGINYLNNTYKKNSSAQEEYNYNYRMALIEYYRGNVIKSRAFFLKCLRISKKHFIRISRFLFISLLGNDNIRLLRKSKVLPYLSLYLNKYLKIDFHQIKPVSTGEK
jgi:glycosyltransferase involved in cell wall biosynthesis